MNIKEFKIVTDIFDTVTAGNNELIAVFKEFSKKMATLKIKHQ